MRLAFDGRKGHGLDAVGSTCYETQPRLVWHFSLLRCVVGLLVRVWEELCLGQIQKDPAPQYDRSGQVEHTYDTEYDF